MDTIRSLVLTIISAGILWFLLKNKLKQIQTILLFTVLILFDLISIDKRYVNEDDFVSAKKIENPFTVTNIDKLILKDTSHYRVANFAIDPLQDGRTSYFHNSIGGYHAAKMGRYQELFDYQISKNNMSILDMLNAKYIIFSNDNGRNEVEINSESNGNAWFVNTLFYAKNANEEMTLLDSINNKSEAILKDIDYDKLKGSRIFQLDSTAIIELLEYDITKLKYQSKTTKDQFAVFSEIYYENGWNAYIDDVLTPHYNVNYVLRGMVIPKGIHKIEFKFEPNIIKQGEIISLISYALLLLIPIGFISYNKKNRK